MKLLVAQATQLIPIATDRHMSAVAIKPINSSAMDPHNFWIRAISPCPPRKPIASRRLIYSHAFVTVTRLRRSRGVSTVCVCVCVCAPPLSFLLRVPPEGTRPSLYFFSLSCGRPPSSARAGQVSSLPRSSLFPAGPFSPLAGFSRLAPGHYLIFRLETSHPQEKRSRVGGRGARGGRKGGHRAGGDRGSAFA